MTPPRNRLPHLDNNRPLKRPGHGLIQDVRPSSQSIHTVAPVAPVTPVAPIISPASAVTHTKTTPRQRRLPRFSKPIVLVAAILVVIASILLSAVPVIGEAIVIAYGIAAIILRIPSRISFALALFVLAGIGIEFLLLPGIGQANNSALFAFLFLGIGLIASILETRRLSMQNTAMQRR